MVLNPDDRDGNLRRWGWILPPVLAVMAHIGLLRAGLVLDEPRLVSSLKESSSLSPGRVFVEHYIRPKRVDPGYRPLAIASLVAVEDLAGEPWAQRAVNILLHAGVAAGVWFLLHQMTRNTTAATAAACVFAVLPVHSDAVARLLGRAELLGALGGVWAWAIAIVNARRAGNTAESSGLAALIGGLMLLASFAHESAVVLLPVLIPLSCLALGLRLPWISTASALGAVLGSFAVRGLVLEGRSGLASHLFHPLREAGILERILHAPAIATLHAVQTLLPFWLSAERTVLEAPPWGPMSTFVALFGWIAAIVLVVWLPAARRVRLIAVGLAGFLLLIAPAALMISPLKRMGAESAAYLPSVGWMVVAAGAAVTILARTRPGVLALATVVLCAGFGARTWLRNEDWVSGDVARLVPARSEPDWARRLFEQYGEIAEKTPPPLLAELRSFLEHEATRLAIASPGDGWTEALQGHVLFHQNKHAEAIDIFTQAESILGGRSPPESSPRLYQLRGEAHLYTNQTERAFADMDKYIRLMDGAGRVPDAQVLSRRGLCHAKLERFAEAMVDFDRALSIRKDVAEIWNNRGFLRYKLDDLKGAVEDYREGYTVCVNANVATSNQGDSAQAFCLRIADVYTEWGQRLQAEGRAEEGKQALEESQKFRQNAYQLGPPPATMSGGK